MRTERKLTLVWVPGQHEKPNKRLRRNTTTVLKGTGFILIFFQVKTLSFRKMQLAQNIIARNYLSQDSIPNFFFFNSKSSFQCIVNPPPYKNYNVLTGKDYVFYFQKASIICALRNV